MVAAVTLLFSLSARRLKFRPALVVPLRRPPRIQSLALVVNMNTLRPLDSVEGVAFPSGFSRWIGDHLGPLRLFVSCAAAVIQGAQNFVAVAASPLAFEPHFAFNIMKRRSRHC